MYLIGIGWDVPLVSLLPLDPQPRSPGMMSRRDSSADGNVIDRARHIELLYDALDPPALYLAVLTQYGLEAALRAAVTLYAVDETYVTPIRWNGWAIRPAVGDDVRRANFMLRDISILIRDLQAAV